jgi:hypothetical protein
MNIIETAEKECAVLGSLFQGIVNEMKVCINIYDNIQLLPVRQKKRKMKKKLHLFNKRHHLRDLSMPRSSSLHASVILPCEDNDQFFFNFFFRTVQRYGKIYHQKQTKCMYN